MWTGRETLGSIESAIGKLYREETQLDGSLKSAVAETERLRKERAEALRELARVKLDEMAAGRLVNNLDAGERRAVQVLDDYRLRIASLTERRERLLKELESAQAGRDAAAKLVEEALAAVEALRAEVEGKVQALAKWREAKSASDAANGVAGEAEKKAANAEAELGAKQKPYDEDPLFVYLWKRGFGTGRYEAGNLTRFMDRMVADFIDFSSVRPNYAALIEIPLRLREHATAKRAAAEERLAALSGIERRAMVEAGIEPKERTLAEARHRLAAADTTLDEKHGLLRKLDTERNGLLSAGSNPAYEEALSAIASADAKDQMATLYLEARRTPTAADDAIVKKLEGLERADPQGRRRGGRAAPHRPGPGQAAHRDRARARPLPRRRLRPSARYLRQRHRHRRRPGPDAGRQHRRPGPVGDSAGRLQHARARGAARLRLPDLAVPLPHPRRRQQRPLGRRVARPLEPRQLVRRRQAAAATISPRAGSF